MVQLKKLSFENYHKVLKFQTNTWQKEFVEEVSITIALAYAGVMEQLSGELCVIYADNEPVGIVLIGKGTVNKHEPKELQRYQYVYRIMGLMIDIKYQNKGIGKQALQLVINKILAYADGKDIPIALEVNRDNIVAIKLYKLFGFYDTGICYDDDCVFVRFAELS